VTVSQIFLTARPLYRPLVDGDVRSQSKRNVTQQAKAFSERLEASISRYHANALTTAQVIEELIQLARTFGQHGRVARKPGSQMRKLRSTTHSLRMRVRDRSWANRRYE
jgi:Domain of unknown function (DUF3387)